MSTHELPADGRLSPISQAQLRTAQPENRSIPTDRDEARAAKAPNGAVPGWRRYLFFVMAVAGLLMSSIDSTIVAVGIPTFITELQTDLVWIGWVITGYQLVQTIVMPTVGKLSDVLGRKQVFLTCIALFTLGSLLCSLSSNVYFLIFARVIQGLGGGGLMPSATGIVADQFPEKRAQMLGLFTSILPIGGIIGPNLGGFILANYSWRALFWVNLPIGVIVFISIFFFLKYEKAKSTRKVVLDVPGTVLYAAGIVSLMYAVTELGNGMPSSDVWQIALLALVGLGFLVMFVRQESRAASPIIEIRLLKERAFFFANVFNFFYGACVFGFFSFVPYYATTVYNFNTFDSGAILTPRAICMIITSTIASIYVIKLGYRPALVGGMSIVGISLLLMGRGWMDVSIFGIQLTNFVWLAIVVGIAGIGAGLCSPAANNAVLDLMPDRIAAITGLRGMFRMTGGMFGVSFMVMFLNGMADKGQGMKDIFTVLAIMMVGVIALAFGIPDTARQRHLAAKAADNDELIEASSFEG